MTTYSIEPKTYFDFGKFKDKSSYGILVGKKDVATSTSESGIIIYPGKIPRKPKNKIEN